jgi:hypothetical protein
MRQLARAQEFSDCAMERLERFAFAAEERCIQCGVQDLLIRTEIVRA